MARLTDCLPQAVMPAVISAAVAFCAACGTGGDDSPGAPRDRTLRAAPDAEAVEAPPETPDAAVESPGAAPAPEGPPETLLTAVNTLGFTRPTSPGIAPGFNLDERVSDTRDNASCRKPDFTSPEGEPGIDNQLATLVPLFELVGIGAVEGLVQNSIEEGGLLIMLQTDDINDRQNDDTVSLHLRFGQGTPLLGTDGLLLSGQTFHEQPAMASVEIEHARIEDGVLQGGPFDAELPIVVFGVEYRLPLHNAFLRATLTYDGGLEDGILGGAVSMEDIITIATRANEADGSILAAVRGVLNGRGDLEPDEGGVCRSISGAFDFAAVSAYLY